MSYRSQALPLSYVSIFLGALSLAASVVFFPHLGLSVGDTVTFLGLGKGGYGTLAINPLLMWVIGLGAYLIAHRAD